MVRLLFKRDSLQLTIVLTPESFELSIVDVNKDL